MQLSEDFAGPEVGAARDGRPVGLAEIAQFDALYRAIPDYYGTKPPRDFREFLAGRSLGSFNCLDLGAGQGRYALHMARAGARVRAVDQSPTAMAQLAVAAKAEKLAITTEVADLCAYALPSGGYDLIVGATVLDHLDESCRNQLAVSITTALKPGGTVYCEVFTTADPGWQRQSEQPISETAGPVRHYFAAGELRGLFPELTPLAYREGVKQDRVHGVSHCHGLALLVGIKQ